MIFQFKKRNTKKKKREERELHFLLIIFQRTFFIRQTFKKFACDRNKVRINHVLRAAVTKNTTKVYRKESK